MILTTKSKYAVIAIVEMATGSSDMPMTLATISHRQNISLSYLEQIFLKLRRQNIVTSVKGPGGGYKLSTNAAELTIENIIVAMEENLKMTRCATDKNCKKDGVICKTHNLWKGFGIAIRQYFASISVQGVVEGKVVI